MKHAMLMIAIGALILASACLGDEGCYEECRATSKDKAARLDCYKAACGGDDAPVDP